MTNGTTPSAADQRAATPPPRRGHFLRAWARGPLHDALLVTLGGALVALGAVIGQHAALLAP